MNKTIIDKYNNKWVSLGNEEKYVLWNDGSETYFKDGNFHNLNGHATKWRDGTKRYYIKHEWYHNFIQYIRDVIKYKKENNE